jgi:hypothetical protein
VLTGACAFNSESNLRKEKRDMVVWILSDLYITLLSKFFSPFLIKHHTMKLYSSGGKNPSILNLEPV